MIKLAGALIYASFNRPPLANVNPVKPEPAAFKYLNSGQLLKSRLYVACGKF